MESIEKLRDELSVCGCDPDECMGCDVPRKVREGLQAIEREIAERYMELPVDADGVPIRLGDELDNINKSERYKVTSIGDNGYIRIYSDTGWIHSSHCRHVKPRTVEDVLMDAGVSVAAISDVAAEIRELLCGDGR